MFQVENADFIADKLAAELLPLQEFREAFKNALEAVHRRLRNEKLSGGGRIEFDVDWSLRSQGWYIACADNGDGMSRSELERYMTTLAVQGASGNQSLKGNQGMGLKISGPTRHRNGIIIRSLKNGERTMVQIGWDAELGEYGLIPIGQNDELVVSNVAERNFPDFILQQGSGTLVTFLGSAPDANTVVPPGETKGWLMKYLNQRFFRLSNDDRVKVVVRVPSGDIDEWPESRDDANKRRPNARQFNMTRIDGTGVLWDEASSHLGESFRGVVALLGDASTPQANMHWWVLPSTGVDVSTRTAGGGSFAVLFDNELHDWRRGNQANVFFARLGVLYGKSRIAFVLEPKGDTITSDFARAHVLVGGAAVVESDAWLRWAEQFRNSMPEAIKQTMAEEQARLEIEDPDRVRRIRDRLREVMQLLRPRRFRKAPDGPTRAATDVMGAGPSRGEIHERSPGEYQSKTKRSRGRGIGAALAEVGEENGSPATEILVASEIQTQWVTEDQADTFAIVNGNGNGMRDRAAALVGQDGRTASTLLLNRDFRGYQSLLAAMNEHVNPEGDDDKLKLIEAHTQEWIEQKMIEAVQGLRQLENGRTWITEHFDSAFSPVALTAAFMADRYHTLREVRRALGPLRTTASKK